MKVIDLSTTSPTLPEVLELAGEDNVLLRTPEGRQYVLAEIDDFAEEVARVGQNGSLMQLLRERSKETSQFTLSQVREQLQGKKKINEKSQGNEYLPLV
jgi:hypothetical protein